MEYVLRRALMESKNHPLRRELVLPNGATQVIRSVMPILEKWWTRDRIVLGGGTALAARWKHRSSTNVGLFVDQTHYKTVYREMWEEMCECFASLAKVGELHHPILNSGYLSFTTPHGSVSLQATEPVVEEARVKSSDREVETQLALESTQEILARS